MQAAKSRGFGAVIDGDPQTKIRACLLLVMGGQRDKMLRRLQMKDYSRENVLARKNDILYMLMAGICNLWSVY